MAQASDTDDQRGIRPVGDGSLGRKATRVNSVRINDDPGRPPTENGAPMDTFFLRNGDQRRSQR
jgi:hypothetical protein